MAARSMADAVRSILVKSAFNKSAFVPGDPAAGGAMPPGGDPAAAGGMPPPGMDPAASGGDPAAAGGMPPGVDPSMMGGDPMAGMPMGMDPSMMGAMPQTGMINMTADEFTKFIKQMMAAFGQGGAPAQQAQPDISAKLDTLIAVIQGKASQPAAPVVAGA